MSAPRLQLSRADAYTSSLAADADRQLSVIREMYNGVDAQELFENELDRALDAACEVIVIEPERLGEDTARWIGLGDCLNSTVLVAGSGSIVACVVWQEKPYVYCPLTGLALFCAAFYNFSWKQDPCSMYRTATESERHARMQHLLPYSPKHTVLIRRLARESDHRSLIQSTVALISLTFSVWKLVKWIKFVAA